MSNSYLACNVILTQRLTNLLYWVAKGERRQVEERTEKYSPKEKQTNIQGHRVVTSGRSE